MSPENNTIWQKLYSIEDAYWEDVRRFLTFGFYTAACTASALIYISIIAKIQGWPDNKISLGRVIFFLILIAGSITILRIAKGFLLQLYRPDPTWNVNQIILRRLFGIPAPPFLKDIFKHDRVMIRDGSLEYSNHWVTWIGGPALLRVMDNSAVYLEGGNRFSRVVGSGMVLLHRNEIVRYVLDLRPREKKDFINAWTKDGIKVSVEAYLRCRIGRSTFQDPNRRRKRPFDPIAVKRAVEATSVRFDEEEGLVEFNWFDGAWGRLQGKLTTFIAGHKIDELIRADSTQGITLFAFIEEEISTRLNEELENIGVTISDLQIIQITPPELVEKLLIYSWAAERQSLAIIEEGKSKAEQLEIQLRAELDAQQELNKAINNGLKNIGDEQFSQYYSSYLSAILDRKLDDPSVRVQMTEIVRETLAQLKDVTQFYDSE